MGLSGLLLILFLVNHLYANLLLLVPDGGVAYNTYSYKLHSFGHLLTLARIGLAVLFLAHIITGLRVFFRNISARRNRYAVARSKGGTSKLNPASRWMIVTGIILLFFIPWHVSTFSMGPYYPTVINGVEMRDLYTLVVERFSVPAIAYTYAAVMFFLTFHLAHGLWSALQSLGAMNPRLTPAIYSFGILLSILIAGGFFILPLYIHFTAPLS